MKNTQFKPYIIKAIEDLNFKEFSFIQEAVFEKLNTTNKNLMVMSKTGSGKTHAFLLPIFQALEETDKTCQAVIVTPTTELAHQILQRAKHIASFSSEEIVVKAFVGGTDWMREIEKLKTNPPQIVIATPGKLQGLAIQENELKIHDAKFFVMDEADMVADSFLESILIISERFKQARKLLFSATIREELEPILRKFLTNCEIVQGEKRDVATLKIDHYLIPVRHRKKDVLLAELLETFQPYLCIIFSNRKETVTQVYQTVKDLKKEVVVIHGDMPLRERKRIMKEIHQLKYQYIVASDVVARGIDIEGVSHIVNYDLPRDFEFYIHRSGRTGRMNMNGVCYSFYEIQNDEYLNNLEKRGIQFQYLDIKQGQLVEYRGRNIRSNRVRPEDQHVLKAKKLLGKPKKVTPGYKKKIAEKAQKMAKTMKHNERRRSR